MARSSAMRRPSSVPRNSRCPQAARPRLTTSQQVRTPASPGTFGSYCHSSFPEAADVRLHFRPRGRDVDHPVDHQRGALLSPCGIEVGEPGEAQFLHVAGVDLRERRVALLIVGATVRQPVCAIPRRLRSSALPSTATPAAARSAPSPPPANKPKRPVAQRPQSSVRACAPPRRGRTQRRWRRIAVRARLRYVTLNPPRSCMRCIPLAGSGGQAIIGRRLRKWPCMAVSAPRRGRRRAARCPACP